MSDDLERTTEAQAGLRPGTPVARVLGPDPLLEAWRRAREESAAAYAAWCATPPACRRMAYAVFLAAADREAAAERACMRR